MSSSAVLYHKLNNVSQQVSEHALEDQSVLVKSFSSNEVVSILFPVSNLQYLISFP